MKKIKSNIIYVFLILLAIAGCKKNSQTATTPDTALSFKVNDLYNGTLSYSGLNLRPVIQFTFDNALNTSSLNAGIKLLDKSGNNVAYSPVFKNSNKVVEITPSSDLAGLSAYQLKVEQALQFENGGKLLNPLTITLKTGIDSSNKFPLITDEQLLTLVQQQTFKYFWDFGHPVSGLARERNTSGEVVTSGGSGFGIMAIITGIHRNFITRVQGLARMQTMVGFLKNNATKFKGAFPHWLNGTTGAALPFSTRDNGADLVETSYLIQGLLCARQYFNGNDAAETALRNDINTIWQGVEWSWFRQNNLNLLYWHWSPNYNWEMNLPVRGWNECLITYVLAAASPTYSIPKIVYDNGWTGNGQMRNGNSYYGINLPLGPAQGGPLFFAHYSFLGINPKSLTDIHANYETQNINHTRINREYCKLNPKKYYGYSDECWGLTASDIPGGYGASSPTNDRGVIAPTAALSSFPYTPVESMKALKFFYYKLGDKLWGNYGFYDAFSLQEQWFASSTLAIDQGPIIVMIENHRSGLLWNLFMSCPEVKTGMLNLGFQSPHL
jgi:hypothetical protein